MRKTTIIIHFRYLDRMWKKVPYCIYYNSFFKKVHPLKELILAFTPTNYSENYRILSKFRIESNRAQKFSNFMIVFVFFWHYFVYDLKRQFLRKI